MKNKSLTARVRSADEVLFRNLGGEAVLLSLVNGTYYGLDRVGTRIWELIRDHEVLEQVVEALLAEYDVDENEARQDLIRLVGNLEAQGLVQVTEEPSQDRRAT